MSNSRANSEMENIFFSVIVWFGKAERFVLYVDVNVILRLPGFLVKGFPFDLETGLFRTMEFEHKHLLSQRGFRHS